MYQEEKKKKIRRLSSNNAVSLAIQGKWQEAVEANSIIIAAYPDDVDAYNRLGKAYLELGEYARAKETYNKALELDRFNLIAKKNLERLAHLQEESVNTESPRKFGPQLFVEEVGKAKVVRLNSVASRQVLSMMAPGDVVNLEPEGTNLMVKNSREEELGYVDPKYGQRLIKLMEGPEKSDGRGKEQGNRYESAVVSAGPNEISIIIREVEQHPVHAGRLSFPKTGQDDMPYAGDRLIRREEDFEEEVISGGVVEPSLEVEPPVDDVEETEEVKADFEE